MPKPATIEKFHAALFEGVDTVVLTPSERDQLQRIRAIFTMQLDKPYISNKEIATMLCTNFGINSMSQAYRDIARTQQLLGSVSNSNKVWIRYLVTEGLKSLINRAIEEGDLETEQRAYATLAKCYRLNMEDPDPIPYEDIVPQQIDYVNDPSILTGVPVDDPRAMVERIKRKYIDFEEVNE